MSVGSRVSRILRNLFRKPQVEKQLDEEVRAYVDMLTDERIAAGMPAAELVGLRWSIWVAGSR